jgi:magnesium transporter
MAHTRAYRGGELVAEEFPVTDVSEHLAEAGTIVWVDLCGPSAGQLNELRDELGFHELAVEDALSAHQRPKLDRYPNHLFLSCHAIRLDPVTGALATTEVDAFINERWLITVRKDDGFPVEPLLERWNRSADLAAHGVRYLVYGLLDVVVDGYFDGIAQFDEFYERVSDGIFAEHPLEPAQQRHWFEVRQALGRFHRLVAPMREVVSSLMRSEHGGVDPEMSLYFQDVYDHVLRVTESTEALRDLASTIVETNLALRDYRLNQVVKKVTGWAAIIAVPTLITGFYGMNVPFPGFARDWGATMSAVLLVVCTAALYLVFKKKDWL